jgi:hypothetical protein
MRDELSEWGLALLDHDAPLYVDRVFDSAEIVVIASGHRQGSVGFALRTCEGAPQRLRQVAPPTNLLRRSSNPAENLISLALCLLP